MLLTSTSIFLFLPMSPCVIECQPSSKMHLMSAHSLNTQEPVVPGMRPGSRIENMEIVNLWLLGHRVV